MSSRFISRFTCLAICLLLLTVVYAYAVEPRMIVIEEVDIPIASLPEHLDGFTIGVLADLHLETTPLSTVRAAAQRLAALKPDIAVIAGDLAEESSLVESINKAVEPLKSPYGVPGNWDRWTEEPDSLSLVGIEMLVNRGVLVAPGLWLCGIDDALLGSPSVDRAIASAPPGSLRILVAHEPDVANWVKPKHEIALQISGHSHGGQIRLPYLGSVLLPPLGQDYPIGLAKSPTHRVYTTRGVGTSHIPVRFLCPPEITLIRLVRQ